MDGWGANWRLYYENERAFFYYDTESVTHPSKNIVRVWEKRVFRETYVNETVKKWGDAFKTLNYAISLREINCKNDESWPVASHAYSTEYRVLFSSEAEDNPWNFIVPHFIDNELYKRVCK